MPASHNSQRQKFLERLARIRNANPGWDIRKAPPGRIGWVAERGGESLHAVTLTELETQMADHSGTER